VSVDPEIACCEQEAAHLLPWYINGGLAPSDAERVASHLERCEICRADAEHQRTVRALLKSDARIEYAPQPGLSRTLERIDALEHEAARTWSLPGVRRPHRWLVAAVIIQAMGLGVLGSFVYHGRAVQTAARYSTLSAPLAAPSALELRAVFAPSMSIGELKGLLAAQHLSIVRGPTEAGAYTLAVTTAGISREQLDGVIAALRGDPRALFVEPVYHGESTAP
jgi:anti-sigma factor RsiW